MSLQASRNPALAKSVDSVVKRLRVAAPLSPATYFRRNPGRVLPMALVVVFSVFLIAGVVAIANSIDLTVRTIYRYTEFFTYLVPQRQFRAVPDEERKIVAADPRVERIVEGSIFMMNIKTVIGRLPFVVLGASESDRNYLMDRIGTGLIDGRMPAEGMPEAVISEPVARNRGLKIGDIIAGPTDEGGGMAGAPVPVRLVGILSGPIWVAMTTKSFADSQFLLNPKCLLVTTKRPSELDAVNRWMMPAEAKDAGKLSPEKVQVLSRENLLKEIRDSLSSMYLIMDIVSGAVMFVIALVCGMMANIYFTQRLVEFGVLAALGVSRGKLIARVVGETLLITLLGWIGGGILTVTSLSFLAANVFPSRGLFLNPLDTDAYLQTVPIPIAITLFSVVTIAGRLMRLDPVAVIERR